MYDEILMQTINMLDSDIEVICKFTELAPLLDDAGSAFFPHSIALPFLIQETIRHVEAQMTALTAHLRSLSEE